MNCKRSFRSDEDDETHSPAVRVKLIRSEVKIPKYKIEQWRNVSIFDVKTRKVTNEMRIIVIAWFIDVMCTTKIRSLTLHRASAYFDHYLFYETGPIEEKDVQLYASACFLIATKFEEVYHLSLETLVYYAYDGFTEEQLIAAESHVLKVIGWNLCVPTIYEWASEYANHEKLDDDHIDFVSVIANVMLLTTRSRQCYPWDIAKSCVDVCKKVCSEHHLDPEKQFVANTLDFTVASEFYRLASKIAIPYLQKVKHTEYIWRKL